MYGAPFNLNNIRIFKKIFSFYVEEAKRKQGEKALIFFRILEQECVLYYVERSISAKSLKNVYCTM